MGTGTDKSQILVLDPAVGRNATNQKEGKTCTLPEAGTMTANGSGSSVSKWMTI